jgi:hypothetical protein
MARLTRGEQRLLGHYIAHPRGVRLHGPLEPLTRHAAHQLAPRAVPLRPAVTSQATHGLAGPSPDPATAFATELAARPNQTLRALVETPEPVSGAIQHVLAQLGGAKLVFAVQHAKNLAAGSSAVPDPIAEAGINVAATLGIGGLANLARSGTELGVGEAASALGGAAESAPDRSVAQILADAARGVRAAPQTAREGVERLATTAGQRAAAARAADSAAGYALRHPRLTQIGGLGTVGATTGKHAGGLQVPTALVQGSVEAVNPWDAEGAIGSNTVKTLATTGRAIEGAVTAPLALGASAVDSVAQGSPNPFLNTAGALGQGLGQIGGNLLSGDPARVRKATEEEAGLSLLPLLPRLGDTDLAHAGAAALRDHLNTLRGKVNTTLGTDLRHGPDQGVTAFRTNQKLRRDVSELGTLDVAPEEYVAHKAAQELTAAARRSGNAASLGNLRATLRGEDIPDEDLLQTLADTGIASPEHIPFVRGRFPVTDDLASPRDVNLHRALDHLERNPDRLGDPALLGAVEKLREIQHQTPEHLSGADTRAAYLTQAHMFGVRDAAERVPGDVEDLLPKKQPGEKPWTRSAAWAYVDAADGHLRDLKARTNKAVSDARVLGAQVKEIERDERRRQRGAGARRVTTEEPRRSDLPVGGRDVLRPAQKSRGAHAGEPRLPESQRLQKAKALLVHAQAEARGLRAETKGLGRHLEAIRKGPGDSIGLNDLQRPWSAVSSRARRQLWTPEMVADMKAEVQQAQRTFGFREPVWTHHGESVNEAARSTGARGRNSAATEVPKVRRSPGDFDPESGDPLSLAGADTVDRTFAAVTHGSIEGPARTRGLKTFTRHVFEKYPIKLKIHRGDTVVDTVRMTAKEWSKAVAEHQISERGHIWVPESDYKQVMLDAPAGSSDLARLVHQADRSNDRGSYGVVLPKSVDSEYKFQVNPTQGIGDKFAATVGNGLQRYLLLSPAWIEAQAVAELLPALMADPAILLKTPHIWKEIRAAAHDDPNAYRAWAAVVGEGPIRTSTAAQLSPGYQSRTHGMFSDAARHMEHSLAGRVILASVKLKPFAIFDQWRQGKYSQVWAAARLDKELNGFLNGLQGMLRNQRDISDELRGRPAREAIVELGRNPRYKALLAEQYKYMNDVRGNWRSFTSWERKFAPLSVFYGFLRYAMRWPLHFARRHPLAATVNYFLAQANSNELEKILGGKPSSFFKYSDPVLHGADGEPSVIPGGTRVAATGSPILEGLGEGDLKQAAISAENPGVAALEGLFTGTNTFGEHEEDGEGPLGLYWSLAAKEMVTGTPLSRLLGIDASHSQTTEELNENEPHRQIRSFAAPLLPESAEAFKTEDQIIKAINEYEEQKKANGGFPPSATTSSNPFIGGSSSSSSGNPFLESSGSSSAGNPFLGG